jgi:hypothetical protein
LADSGRFRPISAPFFAVSPSSERSSSLPPSPSAEIVGDVCHGDGGFGALYADGADEKPHPIFLMGEDMLDAGANLGLLGVGPGGPLRHWFAFGLLAVDAADLAAIGQELLVGG